MCRVSRSDEVDVAVGGAVISQRGELSWCITTCIEKALVKATITSLPAYSPSLDRMDTAYIFRGGRREGRGRGNGRGRGGERGEG